MELWQEILEKQKMLDKAIKELAQNGYKLAECERDYKIAVNKKALERCASYFNKSSYIWL